MKDNFSSQAALYAKYRPQYPQELFDFILANTVGRGAAWDCATGNGQSAQWLAASFDRVYATDISQQQLDHAYKASNIIYSVQPAEQTHFLENQFDLITVSQALHWFRFDAFYTEVLRVGKPDSKLCVWMYSLLRISTAIDAIVDHYHFHTLEPYWDEERKYVDAHYTTIPFPFPEIATPVFSIEYYWTLEELRGYFYTWSALQRFIRIENHDPVPGLMEELRPLWQEEKMRIIFPLHVRMGTIDK